MKKGILLIIILIILLGLGIAIIINVNKEYCYNISHRGAYPVNPYCEKCGGRDGIVMHECTNPNGEKKYCRVCGKLIKLDN